MEFLNASDITSGRATPQVLSAIVPHSSGSDNAGGEVSNRVLSAVAQAVADAAASSEAALDAAQAAADREVAAAQAAVARKGEKRSYDEVVSEEEPLDLFPLEDEIILGGETVDPCKPDKSCPKWKKWRVHALEWEISSIAKELRKAESFNWLDSSIYDGLLERFAAARREYNKLGGSADIPGAGRFGYIPGARVP